MSGSYMNGPGPMDTVESLVADKRTLRADLAAERAAHENTRKRLTESEAACAAMRAALGRFADHGPDCEAWDDPSTKPECNCGLDAALATDAGARLLAVVRAAKAVVDEEFDGGHAGLCALDDAVRAYKAGGA